ncbi:hypothetical protein Trydic_g19801 [Trypoxylus dichotomus]
MFSFDLRQIQLANNGRIPKSAKEKRIGTAIKPKQTQQLVALFLVIKTRSIIFIYYFCLYYLAVAGNKHSYYWRDYTGTIPDDAVRFENLYIAQIPYNGFLPATLYSDRKEAVTECYGRKVTMKQGIKILCDTLTEAFEWDWVNVHHLTEEKLQDYVIGGVEDGSTLYIGKVFHEGEWKIGKVFPRSSGWKGLRIWYNGGDKYVTPDFQLLKRLPIEPYKFRA